MEKTVEVQELPVPWPVEVKLVSLVDRIGKLAAAVLVEEGYIVDPQQQEEAAAEDEYLQEAFEQVDEVLAELRASYGTVANGRLLNGIARTVEYRYRRRLAKEIRAFWQEKNLGPVFSSGRAIIDLSTPQGRWEILALAVLSAAKVKEDVAEATFAALKEEGLLNLSLVVEAGTAEYEAMMDVLRRNYKALISKKAKLDALMADARRLQERWDGDLNSLYLEKQANGDQIIKELQSFDQLKNRAYWVCRVMKVYGPWQELPVSYTGFLDVHVRRVLGNLDFAAVAGQPWEISRRECEDVLKQYFDGDGNGLWLHGRELCQLEDLTTCVKRCPFTQSCTFYDTRTRR